MQLCYINLAHVEMTTFSNISFYVVTFYLYVFQGSLLLYFFLYLNLLTSGCDSVKISVQQDEHFDSTKRPILLSMILLGGATVVLLG